MKLKLIPIALIIGFAGAAQAQLSIYGVLDGSFGLSIGGDKANADAGFHSGGDGGSGEGNSASRVGIKGTTDLGSGIKANFKFETGGIGSDGKVNNDGTFFNRQAWFGFSGSYGEVRLGRQDSVPFQAFIDYDYNGASNGVSAWGYSGVMSGHFARQSGSLQYIAPAMGGFQVQLGAQLKASVLADGMATAGNEKDVFSGGVTYAAGPLSVSAGFQTKSAKGGDDYFGIAGGYDFGVAKVTVGYHDAKSVKGISLGAQTTLAGANVGVIYGKETELTKGSAFELYINKEVLKNTIAYAEMGNADKKTAGGKGTGYAVGLIYVF